MPEYIAPGVYVEETSFPQKTIEGVSTSTTGFVGPTRFGPVFGEPELLTSYSDFERIYGGFDSLDFEGDNGPTLNYMAHAVRSFFAEGGGRLYVARVFNPGHDSQKADQPGAASGDINGSGLNLRSRHPGSMGNATVSMVFRVGDNVRQPGTVGGEVESPEDPTDIVLRGVREHDTVLARRVAPPGGVEVYWVGHQPDEGLTLHNDRIGVDDPANLADFDEIRVLTVSVTYRPDGRNADDQVWEDLTFHPPHRQSLSEVFAGSPASRSTELCVPIVFQTDFANGTQIAGTFLEQKSRAGRTLAEALEREFTDGLDAPERSSDDAHTLLVTLEGGHDGVRPSATDYRGTERNVTDEVSAKSGLKSFEDLEEISIVAAPGSTFGYLTGYRSNAEAIMRHLISHCERMRYRIAVLDSADQMGLTEVRDLRSQLDTTHAALYYPWVRVLDPLDPQGRREIILPPSGFVTGIYARNDIENGVHKAPANEVIREAYGLEILINNAQQDVLNPLGINCLRFFEGRGFRVWGARTVTSDPEWKYVNLRRYFSFLERSIENGTQWTVFENNNHVLWANIRRTVAEFLFKEWTQAHLMGTKPEEAFFVKCDRTTMTQNDIDNGRLVCLIGVAPLRPAEFVIFRIGQWTADANR